jgi:hypothetical protein
MLKRLNPVRNLLQIGLGCIMIFDLSDISFGSEYTVIS